MINIFRYELAGLCYNDASLVVVRFLKYLAAQLLSTYYLVKLRLKGTFMPKMKTKSGAKKRFIVQGSGGIKRSQAFKRHILTKKSTKTKRQLRGTLQVSASDLGNVRRMLPYA